MRAFASALDAIPLALAENSGLSPIETLTDVKSRQVTENNPTLGIDCSGQRDNGMPLALTIWSHYPRPSSEMKKRFIYDPLISKRQQYLLATQVGLHFLNLPCTQSFAACSCGTKNW
jgi:T-complex protein 1 subunit epsilon